MPPPRRSADKPSPSPALREIIDRVSSEHGSSRESLIADFEHTILTAALRAWPNRSLEARYYGDGGEVDLHLLMKVVEVVAEPAREVALDVIRNNDLLKDFELGDEVGIQIFWRGADAPKQRVQDRSYGSVTGDIREEDLRSVEDAYRARCDELSPPAATEKKARARRG